MVEVVQSDREAAADLLTAQLGPSASRHAGPEKARSGASDDKLLVQAFARHRLAAASVPAGFVLVPEDAERRFKVCLAQAIEATEHRATRHYVDKVLEGKDCFVRVSEATAALTLFLAALAAPNPEEKP